MPALPLTSDLARNARFAGLLYLVIIITGLGAELGLLTGSGSERTLAAPFARNVTGPIGRPAKCGACVIAIPPHNQTRQLSLTRFWIRLPTGPEVLSADRMVY
jgi:hypothetical protein